MPRTVITEDDLVPGAGIGNRARPIPGAPPAPQQPPAQPRDGIRLRSLAGLAAGAVALLVVGVLIGRGTAPNLAGQLANQRAETRVLHTNLVEVQRSLRRSQRAFARLQASTAAAARSRRATQAAARKTAVRLAPAPLVRAASAPVASAPKPVLPAVSVPKKAVTPAAPKSAGPARSCHLMNGLEVC